MASNEVIVGIIVVFFTLLMALIPPFMQFKITDIFNGGAFRSIKIKKLAFMFRSPGGESVSEEGVPIPMFAVQVAGYVLALLSIILNVLLLVLLEEPLKIMTIATISMLGAEIIFLIVFTTIIGRISKGAKKPK